MNFCVSRNKGFLTLGLPVVLRYFTTSSQPNMRLVQYSKDGKQSIGAETENGDYVDLTARNLPNNMLAFLKGGQKNFSLAKEAISSPTKIVQKSEVKLLPPVTGCEKVICVGLNYKDHCSEQNLPIPEEPVIFSKFPSSIVGDGDDIVLPKISDSVDWEVELAVVIGKEGKHIKASEASNYIAGYMVANDVSARDWQMKKNAKQWLLGKTFDTFCPIGPVLVTKDSVSNSMITNYQTAITPSTKNRKLIAHYAKSLKLRQPINSEDPENLNLLCRVNGEIVQRSNTNQLIYSVEECIAWVSRIFTLKPGDLLLTGTPPGVGVFRNPPVYLKDGDVVVCEIEHIGKITNKTVAEK